MDPTFEFAFECRLWFQEGHMIPDMPVGAGRGAVYVQRGQFAGPRLKGKALTGTGGDYALFRPDDVIGLDARYMLQEDDGTLILLRNAGFIWGRKPGVMDRLREWAFRGGPPVAQGEYYFRTSTTFDVAKGKHDWLMRHVFVGVGERLPDGNRVRYYAVT